MVTKNKEQSLKANKVLENAFSDDVNTFKDKALQTELLTYMETKIPNKDLSVSVYVKDTKKKHWRKNDHFVKIFHSELDHLEDYFSLPKSVKYFLLDLSKFLMWETNLLVDEEDNPLNQSSISKILGVHRTTVQRNIEQLIARKVIYEIKVWKNKYYLVNPYVMFTGQYINNSIPKMFDGLGYKSSKSCKD